MGTKKATEEEIKGFLKLLDEIGLSVRAFCEHAAVEDDSADEEDALVGRFRQRFKRLSMSSSELTKMHEYLSLHELFKKSDRRYLPSAKGLFSNAEFEREMLSVFSGNRS